ncbi:hypothetical protein A2592_01340 [Candidatus Kaiserbacteria bacterium RIFOXYD1_FULL_42_15]|uniref:Uncharacterized protein n=1 Tax=Candidatus Kaiserbacteria bacterium RIFOXYD1_FULL_42_15 TaxID=1798532 RepID=A0A1F6FU30_9BACT|nr:MAG: hypothetical protein A2592_01340 [Candidatus Kaiserbacteria bacterium RIFOXYD1_FULL_42_15]
MGSKQQAKIEELNAKISELNLEVGRLSDDLKNEKSQNKNILETKELEQKTQDSAKEELHKNEKVVLNSKIDSLESDLEDKQDQLDRKELKKLAEAFSEQEQINKDEQKIWLISLCVASGLLIIYAVFSIFLVSGKPWLERITYYAIDIILISGVWFCIAQFTEASRLKNDYGNRKTLAQTFNNILNNLAEDQTIKTKFIEKTTDILCAPVGSSGKEPVLSKKVLKDIAEIVGAVANK